MEKRKTTRNSKKSKKVFTQTIGMTRDALNSRSLNSYGSFDFDMAAVNARSVHTKVSCARAVHFF